MANSSWLTLLRLMAGIDTTEEWSSVRLEKGAVEVRIYRDPLDGKRIKVRKLHGATSRAGKNEQLFGEEFARLIGLRDRPARAGRISRFERNTPDNWYQDQEFVGLDLEAAMLMVAASDNPTLCNNPFFHLSIWQGVIEALSDIHSRGWVHADCKPDNFTLNIEPHLVDPTSRELRMTLTPCVQVHVIDFDVSLLAARDRDSQVNDLQVINGRHVSPIYSKIMAGPFLDARRRCKELESQGKTDQASQFRAVALRELELIGWRIDFYSLSICIKDWTDTYKPKPPTPLSDEHATGWKCLRELQNKLTEIGLANPTPILGEPVTQTHRELIEEIRTWIGCYSQPNSYTLTVDWSRTAIGAEKATRSTATELVKSHSSIPTRWSTPRKAIENEPLSDGKTISALPSLDVATALQLPTSPDWLPPWGARGTACAFSPRASHGLVAWHDERAMRAFVLLWDVTTGNVLHRFDVGSSRVNSCAVAPEGSRVLTASSDGVGRVWDVKTGTQLQQLVPSRRVEKVVAFPGDVSLIGCAWSVDGKLAMATSLDSTTRCWDVASGKEILCVAHKDGIKKMGRNRPIHFLRGTARSILLEYSGDEGGEHIVREWYPTSSGGGPARQLVGHTLDVTGYSFAFSADRVLTFSDDGTARVWSWAHSQQLHRIDLEQNQYPKGRCDLSPDGRVAVFVTNDKTLLWHPSPANRIQELGQSEFNAEDCALSYDSCFALTVDLTGVARLWDTASCRCQRSFAAWENGWATWDINGRWYGDGGGHAETRSRYDWYSVETGRIVSLHESMADASWLKVDRASP